MVIDRNASFKSKYLEILHLRADILFSEEYPTLSPLMYDMV